MTGLSFGQVKQGGIQLMYQGKGVRPTSLAKRVQCLAARLGGLCFESWSAEDDRWRCRCCCCFSAWSTLASLFALSALVPSVLMRATRVRLRGPRLSDEGLLEALDVVVASNGSDARLTATNGIAFGSCSARGCERLWASEAVSFKRAFCSGYDEGSSVNGEAGKPV